MSTNKGQYLGFAYLSRCELETREVKLAAESWKKLDELSKKCVSTNHRDPENYIRWVLEYYIYLCDKVEGFGEGILPDGLDYSEDDSGSPYIMTMALKEGAVRSVSGDTPKITSIEIKEKK